MMQTQNNKVIALFMGAKIQDKPDSFEPEKTHTTYNFVGHPGNWRVDKNEKTQFTLSMLCYHVDWSWLMPVVEKIENMKLFTDKVDAFYVEISSYNCEVHQNTQHYMAFDDKVNLPEIVGKGDTKIETVYDAIIKFITWYNTNQQ